jgi:glycosyltransferase involved in cell wall biosynthesis
MRVSVVATVLNEAQSLSRLLDSLAAQTRLPDEVVFCDGGSTDGTLPLLKAESRFLMPPRATSSP